MMIGALEAGGTKMVCAVLKENGTIMDRIEIPTESPDITMPKMIAYFRKHSVEALGIGTFGPVDLNKKSATYGMITTTPKKEWKNYNIRKAFADALRIPVGIDTDVGAAVLGEVNAGSLKGLDTCIYITIGTGIGVGVYTNGSLQHGMMHPEGGHILLSRKEKDTYTGHCSCHDNCFEGLASGPAIEERWGKKAADLANRPEVWELEADYIAQALVNYCMILSPQRIVLGGGVMHQQQLYPLVRKKFGEYMNGYLSTPQLDNLDTYIVKPALKENQALIGCLSLALEERVHPMTHTPFLNLYDLKVKDKLGNVFDYYFASRNHVDKLKCLTGQNQPEGIVIYPVWKEDPEKIVLIRQYRYPLGRYIYELPAGLIDAGESPNEAAKREMKEETGLDFTVYEGGSAAYRKSFYMSQGMTDESNCVVFGYVSGDSNTTGNESTEQIKVKIIHKSRVREIMENNEMSIRCSLLLLPFLNSKKNDPFGFLDV